MNLALLLAEGAESNPWTDLLAFVALLAFGAFFFWLLTRD